MSVLLDIVDFNRQFNTTETLPILVNDFNVETIEERERLSQMVYTHYEGDTLNILPRCECGKITGQYNVGVVCPDCNVAVMAVTERPLESILWVKPVQGVTHFMNPMIWLMLSERMTHQSVNLLRWVCDPLMALPSNATKLPKRLFALEIERGIDAFAEHFDTYIDQFLEGDIIKGTKYQKKILKAFLERNRHKIFCHHLPIPSKLNFITERTVTSTYVDTTMQSAVDAVWTISQSEHSTTKLSQKMRISRTVKANMMLAQYYEQYIGTILVGKKGMLRKHVFGARLHFTARAVIDSLSDNHVYDELHIPWSLATMLFKVHLTSKLIKRGYTPNQCTQLLHEHAVKYNPLLDELFKELITETSHGGIPVLFNRNFCHT